MMMVQNLGFVKINGEGILTLGGGYIDPPYNKDIIKDLIKT